MACGMQIYKVIVQDDNGKLFELDSAWINENFEYDERYDKLKEIR